MPLTLSPPEQPRSEVEEAARVIAWFILHPRTIGILALGAAALCRMHHLPALPSFPPAQAATIEVPK